VAISLRRCHADPHLSQDKEKFNDARDEYDDPLYLHPDAFENNNDDDDSNEEAPGNSARTSPPPDDDGDSPD
jgi:hypothetical protein